MDQQVGQFPDCQMMIDDDELLISVNLLIDIFS
jgi:hypothetical protein